MLRRGRFLVFRVVQDLKKNYAPLILYVDSESEEKKMTFFSQFREKKYMRNFQPQILRNFRIFQKVIFGVKFSIFLFFFISS